MRFTPTKTLAATACTLALLGAVGCGADEPEETVAADPTSSSAEESDDMTTDDAAPADDAAANLVGKGCATYAKAVPEGAGSVSGMAEDPVATAASNNPLLTILTSTVNGTYNKKVDLVDTLNSDEFTVFAPVDDAFKALPKKTLAALAMPKNADMLSTILTYHVVPGQIMPADIAGMQTTVQGEDVEVTGSGDNLKVNDASVICGGVQTANATVYLIDGVLTPPAM
jgi:uncharacterized surface protein with fasciclin (FAS1) repeats